MNYTWHPLYLIAASALVLVAPAGAEPTATPAPQPPAKTAAEEKPALADFPSLLEALSKSANPRWRQLYRPPLAPLGDRNLGAVALGGVITDIYLAAEAFDTRQVKNLCMEVESHARVLGIAEGSAGETRRLAAAAEVENWEATEKASGELRTRLHDLLITQRDPDLATLIEIGFWLRGLEIASKAVHAEPEATDLPLCIASTNRLKRIASQIRDLGEPTKKLPFVIETEEEIGRLIRRWDDTETEADREDVEASHTKVRNLLRRIFDH